MANIWVICKERNNQCFEALVSIEFKLKEKVMPFAVQWLSPLPCLRNISVDIILRNWNKVVFSSPAEFHYSGAVTFSPKCFEIKFRW